MKQRWLPGVAVAVFLAALVAIPTLHRVLSAQDLPGRGLESPGEALLVFPSAGPDGGQFLAIVDPKTRTMGTYYIDGQKGEIALKSVRNISWDLYLEEFNGKAPSPRDIKELLERR